jgi:hypothetical protein
MRTSIIALAFVSFVSVGGVASAKGCIKGAAVGGVAGHVAGKHGVLGAAAGCAVGRHQANKKDRQEAAANTQAAAPSMNTAPAAPAKQQ